MKANVLLLMLLASPAACRAQAYLISTVAGGPPSTPVAATSVSIEPANLGVDPRGNVYFPSGSSVFKVDKAGIMTRIGYHGRSTAGGPAIPALCACAEFSHVAVDGAGNIYFADNSSRQIRKVSPNGTATMVAEYRDELNDVVSDREGNLYFDTVHDRQTRRLSTSGDFSAVPGHPESVRAVDLKGNLYMSSGNQLRKVSPNGNVTTVAGNQKDWAFSGDGGLATKAQLSVGGIAVDAVGNLYIADTANRRVRKILRSGIITTVAGNGKPGHSGDGGPARSAELVPQDIAIDHAGNLYVTDDPGGPYGDVGKAWIRKVSPNGTITTVAGNGNGDGGRAVRARVSDPDRVVIDRAGNLYIGERWGVRKVLSSGVIETVAGIQPQGSHVNEPAKGARDSGLGLAANNSGDVYVVDVKSNPKSAETQLSGVRPLAAADIRAMVARSASEFSFADVPSLALMAGAVDSAGFLLVVSSRHCPDVGMSGCETFRLDRISRGGVTTMLAGGSAGYSGDGRPVARAQLNSPQSVVIDGAGNIYIADTRNERIRKVSSNGVITTVAGTGVAGYSGDGGPAARAQLNSPSGVAVDRAGNLYIADTKNQRVRKVSLSGVITTLAGNGSTGYSGDGGPADRAELNWPSGIAVNEVGNIYVADSRNNAVRLLSIK